MNKLGALLARGRTADVYAWGDGEVIKLFNSWFPEEAITYEYRVAHAVYEAGMSVPRAGEIVEVEGRKGLVYERLDGLSMLEVLARRPWQATRLAYQSAELHAAMHRIQTTEPPRQRTRLAEKIRSADALPEPLKEAALQALEVMPDDTRLCHGDFHPGNILVTARGPMVIDWIDVTSGRPMADLARSILLIQQGSLPPGPIRWIVNWLRDRFLRTYQERYFQIMPGDPRELERWMPIVAAARLNENIRQEEAALLALVQEAFAGGQTG